ncbi:hypothetical protein PVK06_043162 [Gossypium arboreum]|uniref:Aminotransferase-like plant mobile domain-containing protein n=1 Tax=Gossypium arboreum TaxID=29729 RepID=A0ABR0MMT9_GOSAR|nr:hypothetical protein PVK06_043162 [Gossypium arboreum]
MELIMFCVVEFHGFRLAFAVDFVMFVGATNSILDSSAHWWKDRGPGHTFLHFSYGECTITLEDVALQLGLLMDGSVVTGATIVPDKEDLWTALLGKVLNKFDGGRISMN